MNLRDLDAFKKGPGARPVDLIPELQEGFSSPEVGELEAVNGVALGPEYVRWMQTALNKILKAGLATDGIMGARTRDTIRTFQRRHGLPADGIVGPRTQAALIAAGAGPPPGQAQQPAVGGRVDMPPMVIRVRPVAVLDRFEFNGTWLQPFHSPIIERMARQIAASQGTPRPIRTVRLVGHTDPSGSAAYNLTLGRRRADAAAAVLRQALERQRPGLASQVDILPQSLGERRPVTSNQSPDGRARNRRVEIYLVTATGSAPGSRKSIPPDHALCGVPKYAPDTEISLVMELDELERTAGTRAVRPRLSFYQNASDTRHRNHFRCQAARWARRIAAYAEPNSSSCRARRVGPTPYDTGADIIRAIEAVRTCLQRRVDVVHIFGHSGSYGVFGSTGGSTLGLYHGTLDTASRNSGGRTIADIPTAPLAEQVVVVLHGCNMAAGDDNFARVLYQHLADRLRNPRVYGHHNGGCAGRDNSWREYSNRSPNGRRVRSIAPHYQGDGCCTPATPRQRTRRPVPRRRRSVTRIPPSRPRPRPRPRPRRELMLELETRAPVAPEVVKLCNRANRAAQQFRDDLRFSPDPGRIRTTQSRAEFWTRRWVNQLLPRLHRFNSRELDVLVGCLARVEHVVGARLLSMQRLRSAVRPLVGVP